MNFIDKWERWRSKNKERKNERLVQENTCVICHKFDEVNVKVLRHYHFNDGVDILRVHINCIYDVLKNPQLYHTTSLKIVDQILNGYWVSEDDWVRILIDNVFKVREKLIKKFQGFKS